MKKAGLICLVISGLGVAISASILLKVGAYK